jgi:hypothetical protein
MEKELGQIRFVEADGCTRIEVSGEQVMEMFSKCCTPAGEGKEGEHPSKTQDLQGCCTPTEADGCIRIELPGKSMKDMMAFCMSMGGSGKEGKSD